MIPFWKKSSQETKLINLGRAISDVFDYDFEIKQNYSNKCAYWQFQPIKKNMLLVQKWKNLYSHTLLKKWPDGTLIEEVLDKYGDIWTRMPEFMKINNVFWQFGTISFSIQKTTMVTQTSSPHQVKGFWLNSDEKYEAFLNRYMNFNAQICI